MRATGRVQQHHPARNGLTPSPPASQSMNVEAAHNELLKYYQSVSSNRGLMLKILGVLIVFFILFVVVLA